MIHYPELGLINEKEQPLRTVFHDKLDALTADLVMMCRLVGEAMDKATHALLEANLQAAESVIESDARIDEMTDAIEAHCTELLALESPVALDLRIVIGALRISASLERMGDLAEHVAKLARLRYPHHVVPAELTPMFSDMGRFDVAITGKVADIIEQRDISAVAEIEVFDTQVDDLHRAMFGILQAEDWAHGPTTAVDLTLLSRYFERYADHAVSVTRRVVAIVTGDAYVGVRLQD